MGNSQSRSSHDPYGQSNPPGEEDPRRSELAQLFSIRSNEGAERGVESLEARREAKAEREARRAARDKATKEAEREQSIRTEHVDGGYLIPAVPVYEKGDDFDKAIVRNLIISRRIAPFWRGLNDHSDSWTELQLVAAANGREIPAADAIPEEQPAHSEPKKHGKDLSEQALHNLTVPLASRIPSNSTDASSRWGGEPRARARTTSGDVTPDLQQREITLPEDKTYRGVALEAYLYKSCEDCSICFLYYPPYLNKTRCCDQPMCTECFTQIKRPDPHPPEHHGDDQQQQQQQASPRPDAHVDPDTSLVSEPAKCPFCAIPEFGVTYNPPPFRRGLAYGSSRGDFSELQPSTPPEQAGRRRAASLAANDPNVVTTDRIRPDWAAKLANARAHAARRSAAATALHTAAYLMNGRGSDSRLFGRRGMLRRTATNESPGSSSTQLNMLHMMAERYQAANAEAAEADRAAQEASPTMAGPPRMSSRRNRMEDLEEMMMMEAIRLSLASEEERRKKEDKEAKKEEKKKAKQDKKAEKALKKGGLHLTSLDGAGDGGESSDSKGKEPARPIDVPGRSSSIAESPQSYLERSRAQILINDSPRSPDFPSTPLKPSHLRNISGVSSSASSFVEAPGRRHAGSVSSFDASPNASGVHLPQDGISGTPPGGGAGLEPMFNFRSLAAMIGDEDKRAASPMVEHSEHTGGVFLDPLEDETTLSPSPTKEEAHPLAQTVMSSTETDVQPAQNYKHEEQAESKELGMPKDTLEKESQHKI